MPDEAERDKARKQKIFNPARRSFAWCSGSRRYKAMRDYAERDMTTRGQATPDKARNKRIKNLATRDSAERVMAKRSST